MKKSTSKTRGLTMLIALAMSLVGCANIDSKNSERTNINYDSQNVTTCIKGTDEERTTIDDIDVDVQKFCILEGTIYETECFIFDSGTDGPRIAIVGGIHGDERAGYEASLKLKNSLTSFKGKILLIPEASILACRLCQRYPGVITSTKTYMGVTYSDLNRTFPGKKDGSATEMIAYGISSTVESFAPDFVIDLHESRHSYSYTLDGKNTYLGNEIICGNAKSTLAAYDICDLYNSTFKKIGEEPFCVDQSSPIGSFNNYFGNLYKKSLVFTIETNRELSIGRRVEQQLSILGLMMDYFYEYQQ